MRRTPRARSRCASRSIPIPPSKSPPGAGARECAGAPGCRSPSSRCLERVPCALEQDPGEMKLGGGRVVEIGRRIEILSQSLPRFCQGASFRGIHGEDGSRSRAEKNESLPGSDLSSCQANNCIIAVTAGGVGKHFLFGGGGIGRGEGFRGARTGERRV